MNLSALTAAYHPTAGTYAFVDATTRRKEYSEYTTPVEGYYA